MSQITNKLQVENYHLALELRHARGWTEMGMTSYTQFVSPSKTRTEAQNRTSRRQLVRVLPLFRRAAEILGGQGGLDELIAWSLDAGLDGSGVWRKNQVVRSQAVLRRAYKFRRVRVRGCHPPPPHPSQ